LLLATETHRRLAMDYNTTPGSSRRKYGDMKGKKERTSEKQGERAQLRDELGAKGV